MPARPPADDDEFVEDASPAPAGPVRDADLRITEQAQERMRRCVKAAQLRAQHWSYRKIAAHFGWSNPAAAHKAVRVGLGLMPAEDLRELRTLEALRLDRIGRGLMGLVADPGPLVSQGKIIWRDEENGVPYPDKQVMLGAYQSLLKLSAELRRFCGLDAPKRSVNATVEIPLPDIEARVSQLREELGLGGGPGSALPGFALPAGED